MKCPHCRSATTDVFNSRSTKFGNQVWRRRRCLSCHKTFTTYESTDLRYIEVTKKGRHRERYSRAKLFSSVYRAFPENSGRQTTIDAVTDTIEAKLLDTEQAIIGSDEIADIVLQTLKHFDVTAFVRYLATHAPLASTADLRKKLRKY